MADVIEPASSGRAKCRRCGEKIAKGVLRFGERLPNPFGDGEATYWYHLTCAGEKRPEKLATVLEGFTGDIPDRPALEKAASDGVANPKLQTIRRVERSPTGRARCRQCRETIAKDSLRLAIERDDEDFPSMAATGFVHAQCAVEHVGAVGLADKLRRVGADLEDEAKAELEELLSASASG